MLRNKDSVFFIFSSPLFLPSVKNCGNFFYKITTAECSCVISQIARKKQLQRYCKKRTKKPFLCNALTDTTSKQVLWLTFYGYIPHSYIPPSQFPNDRFSPTYIRTFECIHRQVSPRVRTSFPFHRPHPNGTTDTLCDYI